jgi:excisionase family DNA binding protein
MGDKGGRPNRSRPSILETNMTRSNSRPNPAVEPLLDVRAVADVLVVSTKTVRRMIADGRIPTVRVGRSVRIRAADLNRLINSRDRI